MLGRPKHDNPEEQQLIGDESFTFLSPSDLHEPIEPPPPPAIDESKDMIERLEARLAELQSTKRTFITLFSLAMPAFAFFVIDYVSTIHTAVVILAITLAIIMLIALWVIIVDMNRKSDEINSKLTVIKTHLTEYF